MTGQTHVAGGALFTAAGLGAANAAGWMHVPAWALAIGITWGAIAGDLPDIDHPKARVSRSGVAFGLAGQLLGLPARIVGLFIRGLRVTHRGPTHSLAFMALWATIAAPLYAASAGGLLVALSWMIDNVAAVSHTGAHLTSQPAMRFLLAHLAVIYPYAAVCTALGYLSHLVLDSLTGPIPWGWPFACRRISLAPAPLRIRTGSSLETWVVRPALTLAATLAFLEVAGIPLARQVLALGLVGSVPRRRQRCERIHPTGGDQLPESGDLGQASPLFAAVPANSWGVCHSHFAIRGVSATHTSPSRGVLLSARSCSLVGVRQQAETYPLRRSFLEERLGHAVGVVQFDAKRLEETASATTLAGVLVTASNAPIGTLEFDTLTVLLQRYGNAACPDSKQIEFSLYEVLRELGITPGTYQRRDLVQALVRLYQVSVSLPEFDARTGEPVGVRERRLFGELMVRAEAGVIKKVIRERRLSVGAVSGGATGGACVVLADWLAAAVRERHGVSLDLEAQRRLTGTAKTVWVALELLPYIQDVPHEVEHHTLLLTDGVYEGLKLKARRRSDNRRTLQEAIANIWAVDPTYRTLEIHPCAHDKRMRELAIERWVGNQRQDRLRARSRACEEAVTSASLDYARIDSRGGDASATAATRGREPS